VTQATSFSGLVLAGRRGSADPLAENQGSTHRALLDVCGVPMLLRVLRAIEASGRVGRLVVSIDDPGTLEEVSELAAGLADGSLATHRSLDSPSRSVADALERCFPDEAVLVTTADHALLTPEMLHHFADAMQRSDADLLVGMVSESVVRAAYPDTTRTWIRLRGESWTGANLFGFRTPRARRVAEFWVRAERHRKQPWRLVSTFGLASLLLFALRRLDLDALMARISRALGVEIRAVPLPFAEAAIDVDRPTDLELVTRILEGRRE
jgi:GTP:adenosylcobinamide-phosphate guanylyltransferase